MKNIFISAICLSLFLLPVSKVFSATNNAQSKTSTKAPTKNKKTVNLASVSSIVVDAKNNSTLFEKHSELVMPVASITKLMTAMVILDSKLSLKEKIRFSKEDKKSIDNYYSRIRIGSELSRGDVLRIALMSSENLAASALSRAYPGGSSAFVKAMNKKAKALGMTNTHFVNSTGLSEKNVSTASDLAKLVAAATKYSIIKEYSTTQVYTARFKKPRYVLGYTNTNSLIRAGHKDVKLSKTGYLDEAGRCLVILRKVGNKDVIMVFLDSFGKRSPIGDANRIKKWLQTGNQGKVAKSASNYQRVKLAYYSKEN
ncbi:MAG: D-alanyl-D-alanine endopeptidase [Gammaproteobacteria bacterium]|nr:D-alanyl-D-alanine endopeptidase [Gammaproteobacteria bacterium]